MKHLYKHQNIKFDAFLSHTQNTQKKEGRKFHFLQQFEKNKKSNYTNVVVMVMMLVVNIFKMGQSIQSFEQWTKDE